MQLQRFELCDDQLISDSMPSILRHHRNRHHVTFPHHPKPSNIREPELQPAHNVADNLSVDFGNDEGFRAALVNLHEKVRTISLRQADPIDLDDSGQVFGTKWAQEVRSLQQLVS